MRLRRRIERETRTPSGAVLRVVLAHGGDDAPSIFVELGAAPPGYDPLTTLELELDQAEALVHMLADALTIARLGGGA